MAGLYVHIPFCKSRCIYCDFYSTAAKQVSDLYISRLIDELHHNKTFLQDKVSTLYFGGGTPSVLTLPQLDRILTEIDRIFPISQMEEISFESNPDDLRFDYIKSLKAFGINRLSIGIQSFDDNYLVLLRRRHTVRQAINAVCESHEAGFENISIDLMSVLPDMALAEWENALRQAIKLPIKHISAYILSQEAGTMLDKMIAKGLLTMTDEDMALKQFDLTNNFLKQYGFIHYETSSYCLLNWQSKHNSNYWKRIPYLGLGASAHSFNGKLRQWNIASVKDYISLPTSEISQHEILSAQQQYEEYIMLSLRTEQGIEVSLVQNEFPSFYNQFLKKAEAQVSAGLLQRLDSNLVTTQRGEHLLNEVIVLLF